MRNPWQVEQKAKIMAAADAAMIFAFCSTCEVLQRRQQRSFVENDEEPLSNSRIILSSHVRSIMWVRAWQGSSTPYDKKSRTIKSRTIKLLSTGSSTRCVCLSV